MDFDEIRTFLHTKQYPDWCTGDRGKKANFRQKAGNYKTVNSELFYLHKTTRNDSKQVRDLRVVLDEKERQRIVTMCYEGCNTSTEAQAIGGHNGRDKTLIKILERKNGEERCSLHLETICRHGVPRVHINDQGREFVNKVSEELHALTGEQQRITSAYYPQANGLVERNNRTIQTSLLKVLEGRNEEWSKALPGVLFAFNTSRHKSTGFSAFYLMYGRKQSSPWTL
ncbi:uncharacterized protein LOC121388948 [Gigantopelta aegis]|uniref:uncharacterized protein LOC121388948 n=1 Tax=Gigantopelta aegis TaxID=1735272 RepID=UPI001B88DC00|nr:uncharacterized protein LOC121388948 [Gigantopelta aegis]